jgi:hypothetical protein
LRMLEPINRGAAMTLHNENCDLAWSGVLYTAAWGLEPTSMSGSFHAPERGNYGAHAGAAVLRAGGAGRAESPICANFQRGSFVRIAL